MHDDRLLLREQGSERDVVAKDTATMNAAHATGLGPSFSRTLPRAHVLGDALLEVRYTQRCVGVNVHDRRERRVARVEHERPSCFGHGGSRERCHPCLHVERPGGLVGGHECVRGTWEPADGRNKSCTIQARSASDTRRWRRCTAS